MKLDDFEKLSGRKALVEVVIWEEPVTSDGRVLVVSICGKDSMRIEPSDFHEILPLPIAPGMRVKRNIEGSEATGIVLAIHERDAWVLWDANPYLSQHKEVEDLSCLEAIE